MAKPNYAFEKRQRELQKKQKKAEKGQRKLLNPGAPEMPEDPPEQGAAVDPVTPARTEPA